MKSIMPDNIRIATTDDLPFIYDSWLKTVCHTYPNQFALDFRKYEQNNIKDLLNKSMAIILHLPDEPNIILAYLVYSTFLHNQVVLFAYTKSDIRRVGLLTRLLSFSNPDNLPIVFTVPTKNEKTMEILSKKYIFDPTILELI